MPHSVPGTVSGAGSPIEQGAGSGEVGGLCPTDKKDAKETSLAWVGMSATIP